MRVMRALGIAALLALGAQPLAGQMHSSSVGLNFGAVMYSAFNSGAADSAEELKPDLGYFGGIQYDWFVGSGHLGFRLGGHYQQMKLPWNSTERTIYAYAGDFDLLLRPLRPQPDTKVIPYLSAGVGATRYRMGKGNPTSFDAADAAYLGKERTQFSVLGGVGLDFLLGFGWDEGPFMLRLEAQDNYVLTSPLDPLQGGDEFGGIHNIRISLGIHNTMGGLR